MTGKTAFRILGCSIDPSTLNTTTSKNVALTSQLSRREATSTLDNTTTLSGCSAILLYSYHNTKKREVMKHQGTCKCGAVKVGILTDPIMKHNCHCSHCRRFASKFENEPVSSFPGVFVWRWSVQVEGEIAYEPSTGAGGLVAFSRGRCASCKQPVWERGGRFAAPFATVSIPPLTGIETDANIYYDSGLKQGTTLGMKTNINSDFGSLLYVVWRVLTVAIPLLPASIFALFGKHKFKQQ